MKETAIIEFDVKDRDVLLTIFERFKVVFKSRKEIETAGTLAVRTQLQNKYVETGLWQTMDDEERLDAAHAETLIYRKATGEYEEKLTDRETQTFLAEMESNLVGITL